MDVFTAILKKHSRVCAVDWIAIEAVGCSRGNRTEVSGWEVTDELAHFDGLAGCDVGQPFDILASQQNHG